MPSLTAGDFRAIQAVDTSDLSIQAVSDVLTTELRRLELEPEWLTAANFMKDNNVALYGPLPSPEKSWPVLRHCDRLAVSVRRGVSEGWAIHVDWVGLVGDPPNQAAGVMKLLVAKCLTEELAWQCVRAIAKLLDVA